MLKITRNNISIIVPPHWLSTNGFLKHSAVHAVKLFFGDETLEMALEEAKKRVKYGWQWQSGKGREEKKRGGK